jgi:hypothetical protein
VEGVNLWDLMGSEKGGLEERGYTVGYGWPKRYVLSGAVRMEGRGGCGRGGRRL